MPAVLARKLELGERHHAVRFAQRLQPHGRVLSLRVRFRCVQWNATTGKRWSAAS